MLSKQQVLRLLEEFSKKKEEFPNQNNLSLKSEIFSKAEEIFQALHKGSNKIPLEIRPRVEAILVKERLTLQDMHATLERLSKNPLPNNPTRQETSKKDTEATRIDKTEKKDDLSEGLSGAILKEKPNIKWEDVAGLHKAKEALQQAIILPIKFPDIFVGLRKPWKGILLYGVS